MFLGVRAGRKNTNPHCMAPNDIDRRKVNNKRKRIFTVRVCTVTALRYGPSPCADLSTVSFAF